MAASDVIELVRRRLASFFCGAHDLAEMVRSGAVSVATGAVGPDGEWHQSIVTVLHLDGDVTVRVSELALHEDGEVDPKLWAEHRQLVDERMAVVRSAAVNAAWIPLVVRGGGGVIVIGSAALGGLTEPVALDLLGFVVGSAGAILLPFGGWIARRAVAALVGRSIGAATDAVRAEFDQVGILSPPGAHATLAERSEWLLASGMRKGRNL